METSRRSWRPRRKHWRTECTRTPVSRWRFGGGPWRRLPTRAIQRLKTLIRAAYADGNHELKLGALFAMGRTCSKEWRSLLLAELESADSECVYEAIRACGQIQLRESVQRIGEYTLGDDQDLHMMAIWSLGEIGGKRAFEILSGLEENTDDDEVANALDEALDAAGFSLSFASLGLDLDDE